MLTCDIPMGWFTSYFMRTMSFLFPFFFFLFFFFAQAPGKALQHRQVIGVGNQTGTEAFPPQHLPPGAYLFEWRHGKLRGSWSSISPPSPHCFFSLYSHIISFTQHSTWRIGPPNTSMLAWSQPKKEASSVAFQVVDLATVSFNS